MSTPMRPGPSQQGRTPSQHPGAALTPQASTPYSNPQTAAAFSPRGPRSSPQQFKRSPAAVPGPATGTSVTLSATATLQQGSLPVNFDSPSAAAAFGLGINDLNLDNLSVGVLGGGSGRSDEDDRKKRLDAVIDALWALDSGRVSNEGLERLALRLGLECLWESGASGADHDKTLIIAGQTMGVEIGIKDHIVHHASLSFNEPAPSVEKHVDKASAILLQDLALEPEQSPLTKKLSKFRGNLERLTTLDKLSVTPGLNCHEAIAGIWESLERLHRWDVEKLREEENLRDKPEHTLRVYGLCTRHGCPLMHARGRIGLSLDYWKERRRIASTDVDMADAKTWAILIECAPARAMVYNAIRVSDNWIGPNILKPSLTDEEMISATGPVLDWLEPPNTLLPATEESKAEGGLDPGAPLAGPKPPDVVFMATFDPPIVVTHSVAMEIYKLCATNPPYTNMTFDALLFPVVDGSSYDPSEPREMTYTQTVLTMLNALQSQTRPELEAHRNTLYVDKPVYGQVLSQIPFSHPKELVAMLPYLRQYAFLTLLLTNSFKPKEGKPTAPEADAENRHREKITTARDAFADFMSAREQDTGASSSKVLKVDIVLFTHPVPRLELLFPFKSNTANINLEIQQGGKVHIVSDNIFPKPGDGTAATNSKGQRTLFATDWADALELVEDIGIWVTYIKARLDG